MRPTTSLQVFVSTLGSIVAVFLPLPVGYPGGALQSIHPFTFEPGNPALDPVERSRSASDESSLTEAEALSVSWRARDRRKAIDLFQNFLKLSRRHTDIEARASARLGDLHRGLGSGKESLPFYDRALEASAEDPAIRIEAHIGMGLALLRLDDFEGGLDHAERALELSRALGDENLEIAALTALGIAHGYAKELPESLRALEASLKLAETRGDRKAYARSALNLGFTYGDMGEVSRAIEEFQSAIDLSHELEERDIEATAMLALGHAYSRNGEKQRAMELYQRVSPMLKEIDDPYKFASLYTGMAYLYDELGDSATAKDFYTRALRLNQSMGSGYGVAGNFIYLGRIQAAEEEPREALESFRAALRYARQLGVKRMESVVLREIANVQSDMGEEEEAGKNFARALALSQTDLDERWEAETQNDLGSLDLRSGRLTEARRRFQRALELSRKTESPFTESRALFNQARIERASMRLDEALERVKEALDRVEDLRTKIDSPRLRASYVASVFEMHVFHVDLLMELHERRPDAGYHEQAFLAAERAKARSLMEMLDETDAGGHSASDADLVEYRAHLEERLRLETGLDASEPPVELVAELDRIRSMLRHRGSRRESFQAANLVGARELQRELLDERTAVLAYFLGDRASYLWAITPSSITVHRLPPRERLESEVRILHGLLAFRDRHSGESAKERRLHVQQSDRRYWQSASSLSDTLLGLAMGDLDEVTRLVVVGDGVLHQIPFSALPLSGSAPSDPPTPLVARFEIVRLPSASTLKLLEERREARAAPSKKLAVVADPVFDERDPRLTSGTTARNDPLRDSATLFPPTEPVERIRAVLRNDLSPDAPMPRLLSTRLEARRILDLVPREQRFEALGFDANRSLVTSGELSGYEVVHFATHGILDVELPELSGIVLSLFDAQGRKQDGFLTLQDIYDLDLPVRLVVLSACSTGLGKDVRGEGLVGLVGGFLSTGAQGVMASYWDVDDEATAELMRRFYEYLFSQDLAPSKALQLAQSSMWNEKRWLSPRFWGAFELQGHWR